MRRICISVIVSLLLAGCQTTYSYEPFLANAENFEVANAKCQMLSASAEQQIVAWGSPMYVATAQAANTFGNIERVDRFLQNCMTAQGWRRVAKPVEVAVKKTQEEPPPEMRQKGVELLAIEEVAAHCRITLSASGKQKFRELRSLSTRGMKYDAQVLGQNSYSEKTKKLGHAAACRQVRDILAKGSMV